MCMSSIFKQGSSNSELGELFGVHKAQVGNRIRQTRKQVLKHFVPNHIGFDQISRNEVLESHTTELAKSFFGGEDKVVVVMDGKSE